MISDSPKQPHVMLESKKCQYRLISNSSGPSVWFALIQCFCDVASADRAWDYQKYPAGAAKHASPRFLFEWTDMPWLKTTVATLGRLGITMSFEIVYLVNSELYPTTLRYVESSQKSFNFSLCFSPFPISQPFSKTPFSPEFPNWIATAQCR